MENTTSQELTPGAAWEKFLNRLLLIIPLKLTALLDGKKSDKERHPLTMIVPIVIGVLSVASITNMVSRAYFHHPGLAADATGAAIAILVPIAVFAAVHSNLGKGTKALIWLIALIFACVSAAVQFKVYAPKTGFEINFDLFEALAFGAGVPVAECLLAVIEYLLLEQDKKTNSERIKRIEQERQEALAAAQLEEQRKEQALRDAEQRQLEWNRQQADREHQQREDERKQAQEEERQRVLFEFEMEARRLELSAKLEAERLTLAAKLDARLSKPKTTKGHDSPVNHESSVNQAIHESEEGRIVEYYRINALASQRRAATDLGLSQPKISRILNDLESRKVIHRNGNGVEILA